ncbi:hypothetical protein D3C78_1877850 [compost metagenome]
MSFWAYREIQIHTVSELIQRLLDQTIEGVSQVEFVYGIAKNGPFLAWPRELGINRQRLDLNSFRQAQ